MEAEQIGQACPQAHLICSPTNRGFAGGNNLGLKQALKMNCAEILLLNNDARIEADSVVRLQETLQANPGLGIVGPVLWDDDRPQVLLSAGGLDIGRHVSGHILEPPAADEVRQVTYVPGTCVMIRDSTLQTVGLLDEDYFFGGEMADLCARAHQHGFTSAIDGGARATHSVNRSSAVRHKLHIYYVLRNRFLFVRKFHRQDQCRLFAYWTINSIKLWLQSIRAQDWQRARAIRLACLDGWRGRFGGQNARVTKGQIR
jgi:GT2 family glycosyltransferase